MRTRVKICGITNSDDAAWSTQCGADALGFVFYDPSPRAVSIDTAAEIIRKLPAFVNKVGLFVNAEPEQVETTIESCGLDIVQFHGDESRQFCEQFGLPYLKAIRVKDAQTITDAVQEYPTASGLLLDTYKKGVPGGTGMAFNWDWVVQAQPKDGFTVPLILAGGLTPENVVEAIKQVKPFAVDVSGGVEANKGKKDPNKVADFIQGVNGVEH